MNVLEYTLRAEARAVEEGHRAFAIDDGRFRVVSDTYADVDYVVELRRFAPGLPVTVLCACPSGLKRTGLPVPCKHAALVVRRLEREGRAEWHGGTWTAVEQDAPTTSDDPFAGLAGPQLDVADAIAEIKGRAA